ncbi:MAG: hypothetical protein FWH38_09800, partial [Treponema sp.]|nr:hypothetical protein [Treponema sp.]
LHKIPKIQKSIENIEKYSEFIALYLQKQNADYQGTQTEPPPQGMSPKEHCLQLIRDAGKKNIAG